MPFLLSALALPGAAQWTWAGEGTFPSTPSQDQDRRFGHSAAVSGDTAVIGAPGDDTLNADAGAAYVYVRSGATWVEQAVLTASNGFILDAFGSAVAIDGDTIVVGAPAHEAMAFFFESGAAFVFVRTGSTWSEQARLISSSFDTDDRFGESVAISGDTIVVGVPYDDGTAPDEGAAFVFTRSGTVWTEQAELRASQPLQGGLFGEAVAVDADTAVVGSGAGAGDPGSVTVFLRSAGTWSEQAVLGPSGGGPGDRFGASVSAKGDRALVGAPAQGDGSAWVFARSGGSWSEEAELTPGDPDPTAAFGSAVSLEEERAAVGAPLDGASGVAGAGAAHVFRRAAALWSEESKLTSGAAKASEFGSSAALSGDSLWVGAPADFNGTFDNVRGLAPGVGGAGAHALDLAGDLGLISGGSGSTTPLASFGSHAVKCLAYDDGSGTLFGVDVVADQLVTLDVATGSFHVVGPVAFDRVQGLAFDSSAGVLYGVDIAANVLITIDPATAATAVVGVLGPVGFSSLAFNPSTNELYGFGGPGGRNLYSIDRATAAANFVWKYPGNGSIEALSYDASSDRLYAFQPLTGLFITIDVGPLSSSSKPLTSVSFDVGSARAFEREAGAPVGYCTAGTSSSGCQAILSASGAASATLPSGFVLSAAGVEGQKDGLFFFGAGGRQANPWGNGTSYQCVVPPVKRAGALSGTGAQGACDGAFTEDLNALWCPACPKPGANPGAGATAQAQLWYRDPLSTSNQTTSLSDALEFPIQP